MPDTGIKTEDVLKLAKARLGITSGVRDEYLNAIISGAMDELENEKGLPVKTGDSSLLMFIVDYVAWRYDNRGESGGMPRHLQFRLHNLMLGKKQMEEGGETDGG